LDNDIARTYEEMKKCLLEENIARK